MKKYLTIINVFWQRALTYRVTVIGYRIGEIIEVLSLIVLWTVIYQSHPNFGGFTLKEMITYVLVGNLFRVMVRNFLPEVIARDIHEGKLSQYLVRPMDYLEYILVKEIGRISIATIMSSISQIIVTLLFFKLIIINFNPLNLILIFGMLILAFITELLISFLVGMIAFWTDEVDGLYSTVDSLKRLFSGGIFPLSLLPIAFVKISFLLPFAYSFYVPTQIYLQKIDLVSAMHGLLTQIVWIFLLYALIKVVWRFGLKKYESVGI